MLRVGAETNQISDAFNSLDALPMYAAVPVTYQPQCPQHESNAERDKAVIVEDQMPRHNSPVASFADESAGCISRKVCRRFRRSGFCKYGEECRFLHMLNVPRVQTFDIHTPSVSEASHVDEIESTVILEFPFPYEQASVQGVHTVRFSEIERFCAFEENVIWTRPSTCKFACDFAAHGEESSRCYAIDDTAELVEEMSPSAVIENESSAFNELPPTQSVPMSVPHQPMEAQPEAKLSCEGFDVIQVINGWQVLPAEHWSKIHMRFPASHYRLSARTPEPAICYLKEFEQRRLPSGEKFRWLFGSATDHPTVRFGIILRCGQGRFQDQYRVQLDTQSKDEWRDMDKCWPDG